MYRFKYIAVLITVLLMGTSSHAQKKSCGIIAHRGYWNCEEAGYARNSIAALRCAQQAGFWGSEFDVNMTSDGMLIIYHDSEVDGKKIEMHPHTEFKDFKIENGENIPTLDEYLTQAKKYPETMLVCELKPHSNAAAEDRLVELTILKLKEHGLHSPDRVMFISFSLHICERLASELPEFTVQFLGSRISPDKLAGKGIKGIDYNYLVLSIYKKRYKQARSNNMSINSWTVNNEFGIKRMLKLGVDFITTDHPQEVRRLIKKQEITEAGPLMHDE